MRFDPQATLINVRKSTTEDLLERCTAFRDGMEPEALDIIEAELRERGVDSEQIADYALAHPPVLVVNNLPLKCSFCSNAAIAEGWGWHMLFGRLPVFPRRFLYCAAHQKKM